MLPLTVFLRKREPSSVQLFLPQAPRYGSSSPLRLSCPLAPACGNDPTADIIASCRRPSEKETPSLRPCRTRKGARSHGCFPRKLALPPLPFLLLAPESALAWGLAPRSPPWSVSVPDSTGSTKAWPFSSRVQMRDRFLQIFRGAGSQRQWSLASPDPGPRKSHQCRDIATVPQNDLCRKHAARGFWTSEQEEDGEDPGLGVHPEPRARVGL